MSSTSNENHTNWRERGRQAYHIDFLVYGERLPVDPDYPPTIPELSYGQAFEDLERPKDEYGDPLDPLSFYIWAKENPTHPTSRALLEWEAGYLEAEGSSMPGESE